MKSLRLWQQRELQVRRPAPLCLWGRGRGQFSLLLRTLVLGRSFVFPIHSCAVRPLPRRSPSPGLDRMMRRVETAVNMTSEVRLFKV